MSLTQTFWPEGRASFDPEASYEETWQRSTRRCYIPNIKVLHLQDSEKQIFKFPCFLLCSYVHACDCSGPGQFWLQGQWMEKFGRGLLRDATYQISKLYAFQFQRRRILKFPSLSISLNLWPLPPGKDYFCPRGLHLNKLGRGPQADSIYQISNLYNFHFQRSSLFLCSNMWPQGQGQFRHQGHHINKLARGPLGDAAYQILNLYAFQFQRRRILRFSFFVPLFELVTPGAGPYFAPGA